MNKLKDESGVSLIELLCAMIIFGMVSLLITGILFSITKASAIQGQQVEIQQVANNMIGRMEHISDMEGLDSEAASYGKYVSPDSWQEKQLVKVLDATATSEIQLFDQGENPIYLVDIDDNEVAMRYSVTDETIRIKVIQQKNENAVTKTIYSTPNYRDTFSIQVTGVILFYQEPIDFESYYDATTNLWQIEQLVTDERSNIVYQRKFVYTYRDLQKVEGDVPGNGRW